MAELNGLAVGIDLVCACGASVAVVADGRLTCRHCSADRGELAAEAIQFLRDTVRVFGAPHEPVMIFSAIQGKLQMKRTDLFPSKFLRASDLGGKPDKVVIESAALEQLKDTAGEVSNKLVLRFKDRKSALAMNRTNYDSVADMFGDETEGWPGHAIELYPTKTAMGGKVVDCIRIRPPAAKPN